MLTKTQTRSGIAQTLVTAMAIAGLISQAGGAETAPLKVTAETFKNPPNDYRLIQYQLTPATLEEYPDYGIGGYMAFFYKSLRPDGQLKEDNAIGELVTAAHKNGSPVWLADDWGYPSGMAGGRVVAENPDFEVRSLVMLTHKGRGAIPIDWELPGNLHDIVYAALYPGKGGVIDLQAGKPVEFTGKTVSAEGLRDTWELRVFARYTRNKNTQAQSTRSQFGHTGRYPDLMNAGAMSRFIAHMHETILSQVENPPEQVRGFYCNEPNLMQSHWVNDQGAPYACTPWNDALPERFKKRHGYDLFSILPHLFESESDTARRSRIHYRQTVAELLTESFARQIRLWCKERGIQSSGHFLLNDYLSQHVQGYGDLMKFLTEFDVPALDIPIPNPGQFMDFPYQQTRFFSSVTSWKKRTDTLMLLDPIIGGYGVNRLSPDLPLLINSINMATFHGVTVFTSYLPLNPQKGAKGYTKEEFRFLNEYTGRLTQVLRSARREAGVGLYYPIAMFQADLLASKLHWKKIANLHEDRQKAWDETGKALLAGDVEHMIVHPEGVTEAKIMNGHMQIGHGVYHTLVMPQLDFLPLSVAEQLGKFERSGGTVIWADRVPDKAENASDDSPVRQLLKQARATPTAELGDAIPNSFSSDFDLAFTPGTDQLLVGRFHRDGRRVYLLVNRLQEALTVEVGSPGSIGDAGQLTVMDPSTGTIRRERLPLDLTLEANRALLLIR
ncbi:MAG: hypothetical protein P1U68_16290 [Verrucomicrobiales bacterium]|nr:hypothetical protein [Verrucomicrobiales bacterium]